VPSNGPLFSATTDYPSKYQLLKKTFLHEVSGVSVEYSFMNLSIFDERHILS
jgi:hypothetical protein